MVYNPISQNDIASDERYPDMRKTRLAHVTEYEMYPSGHNYSSDRFQSFEKIEKSSSWKSKISIAPAAWEHPLSKKHLARAPSNSDDTRYFDRSRQTRRVFISCLIVWSATAIVCAGLLGVIYYFSTKDVITQVEKYEFNTAVTGLSILLGLTFAAQFKQFCEMLRWRFLASGYRTLGEFDDVLGCDSWRTTLKLIFQRHGKGSRWYPAKSQILALLWLLIFLTFNVLTALVGLTYSIDVSDTMAAIQRGNISVAELRYISEIPRDDFDNYSYNNQASAASFWGTIGQNYIALQQPFGDEMVSGLAEPTISTYDPYDTWWHIFTDYNPDKDASKHVLSTRTVNVTARCVELELIQGGYAGFDESETTIWVDSAGNEHEKLIPTVGIARTTWMSNMTSDCGPRCTSVLALQTANNLTQEDVIAVGDSSEMVAVPEPRMWQCDCTVDQVYNYDTAVEGFDVPELLLMPDLQAQILAGAIGWSGIVIALGEDIDELQYSIVRGDNPTYNPPGNVTADEIAGILMKFTVGAIAAMDQPTGLRQTVTGTGQPILAQRIQVKWHFTSLILGGLPLVQLLMLLVVVWYSGKAIILEPSALTFAHLLQPVIKEIGENGVLMSSKEIEEKYGEGFKISYSVRPDPKDPGPHERDYIRRLGLLRQTEGFGYVRGNMPEGRYA